MVVVSAALGDRGSQAVGGVTGEALALEGQVRLVGVAQHGGDTSEVSRGSEVGCGQEPLEAQDALEGLGAQAHRVDATPA